MVTKSRNFWRKKIYLEKMFTCEDPVVPKNSVLNFCLSKTYSQTFNFFFDLVNWKKNYRRKPLSGIDAILWGSPSWRKNKELGRRRLFDQLTVSSSSADYPLQRITVIKIFYNFSVRWSTKDWWGHRNHIHRKEKT